MKIYRLILKLCGTVILLFFIILVTNCEKETDKLFPEIGISVDTVDFGFVELDDKAIFKVSITNLGKEDLSLHSINLSGTGEFSLLANTTCSILKPNNSCILTIKFAPTSKGSKSTYLIIQSNDPENPNYFVEVKGDGIIKPAPGTWFGETNNSYIIFNVSENGSKITAEGSSLYYCASMIIEIPMNISGSDTLTSVIYFIYNDIPISEQSFTIKNFYGSEIGEGYFSPGNKCRGSAFTTLSGSAGVSEGSITWSAKPHADINDLIAPNSNWNSYYFHYDEETNLLFAILAYYGY